MSSHVDKYLVDRYFRRGSVAVPLHFTGVTGLRLTSAIWLLSRGSLLLPLSQFSSVVAETPPDPECCTGICRCCDFLAGHDRR